MTPAEGPLAWRISIDTGGTFTDCLATDPNGSEHRVKVLSSGCIRGVIVHAQGSALTVRMPRTAPDGFFTGFRLRLTGSHANSETEIIASTADAELHHLNTQVPLPASVGDICELSNGEPAPLLAARVAIGQGSGPLRHVSMRLATTRGTNALLERRGGPAALILTEGFGDLLEIGTQQRPDLFALNIRKDPPVDCRIIEVRGRLDAGGREITPLDVPALRAAAAALRHQGITAVAVALMHSWINAAHEHAAAAVLREAGLTYISLSSDLGLAGLLARAQTAAVNAYLAPVVERFVNDVSQALGPAQDGPAPSTQPPLRLLTSAGGLVSARTFRPKDSLLSGPAGGVVGALNAATASGFDHVLTFDMGGTSTDVARLDGHIEYAYEHRVGHAQVMAPVVAVESVAAGGGSVCWFDEAHNQLRVGPHSAGASPGPASYGAGGPLTITDVNLLLGRVALRRFQVPLDAPSARAAAEQLLQQLHRAGRPMPLPALLEALLAVANEQMAAAMRTISAQRGYNPASYAMVAFGGAGGQHACAVADLLGIRTIIVPRDVGVLSAKGLSLAAMERFAQRQILRPLEAIDLAAVMQEAEQEALQNLRSEGITPDRAAIARRLVGARLHGQEAVVWVEADATPAAESIRTAFTRQFTQLYGYPPPARGLEVESVRVVARELPRPRTHTPNSPHAPDAPRIAPTRPAAPNPTELPIIDRETLAPGASLVGPAIIAESHATTILDRDWRLHVDEAAALILQRIATPTAPAAPPQAIPELLTARLTAIAGDMGETLRRTAFSTNIKDRLDFSCAVLDADGSLVVNAPHIPVHLGALGLCVRLVNAALDMQPGDAVVTNHPAFGGSHLPDVTVISPVFVDGHRVAFVASRAHHAEIGGIRPGSMSPTARSLSEEGVVIPPLHLVKDGTPHLDAFRTLLQSGPFPSRAVEENLADIQAQLAANARGVDAVTRLAINHGTSLLTAISSLRAGSTARVLDSLRRFSGQPLDAQAVLDDGSTINVRVLQQADRWTIHIAASPAAIDTTQQGAASPHPFNLNAPLGVVRSAVMYILRCLAGGELPLNEGILDAVDLRVAPGMLNPTFPDDPAHCPAVSGGNVETSQRLVDALLTCFGVAACSQGTMNNVVFGNSDFGYYETVCGGAGAGPGFQGAHAVHTHMTNTRITDPEILELRYPVRLERFSVRRGSGGTGQFRGGDGVVRTYTFLKPVSLSLLTQNRVQGPHGAAGGNNGAPGKQQLTLPGGVPHTLPSSAAIDLPINATLTLQTPGGGGWGYR